MSRSAHECQDLPVDVKISPFALVCCEFFSWCLLWLVMLIEICVEAMDGFFSFIICYIICVWLLVVCVVFGVRFLVGFIGLFHCANPTNPITQTVRTDWHFGWLTDMIFLNPTWSSRVKYYPQTRPARPSPPLRLSRVKKGYFRHFTHTHTHIYGQFLLIPPQ